MFDFIRRRFPKKIPQKIILSLGRNQLLQLVYYDVVNSACVNNKGWFKLAHKHKHKPMYADAVRC